MKNYAIFIFTSSLENQYLLATRTGPPIYLLPYKWSVGDVRVFTNNIPLWTLQYLQHVLLELIVILQACLAYCIQQHHTLHVVTKPFRFKILILNSSIFSHKISGVNILVVGPGGRGPKNNTFSIWKSFSPNQPWAELLKTSTLLVTYLPTLLLLHHLALLHNRHALVLPQVAALLLVLGTIILVKSTF